MNFFQLSVDFTAIGISKWNFFLFPQQVPNFVEGK